MNAKLCLLCLGAALLISMPAAGQVVPTTPTKFGKRSVGSATTGSSTVSETGSGATTSGVTTAKPESVIRTTTYIVLSAPRQWTSNDGKPLLAKLIAFEEVVTETTKSNAAATSAAPAIPGKPTVIRDGKVRLMVDRKPYEVPLAKLSQADQDFVNATKRAVEGTK